LASTAIQSAMTKEGGQFGCVSDGNGDNGKGTMPPRQ
jgi:hypothetical protein